MLKTQVFEKDEMVAKLMKEKLQLLEKLTLINDKSFDTKNIQCDYWTKTGMYSIHFTHVIESMYHNYF